jgi:hypothetical protein
VIAGAAVGTGLLADALAWATVAVLVSLLFGDDVGPVGLPSFLAVIAAAFIAPRIIGARAASPRATALLAGFALALVYTLTSLETTGGLRAWTFGWLPDFYRDPEATMRAGAPAIVAILLLAGAWARGSARAEQDLDLEAHPRTLFVPFAVVITCAVLGAGSARAGELATLSAAFFAVAVVSLAASQLALGGATLGTLRSGGITATLLVGAAVASVAGFLIFGVAARLLGPTVAPAVGTAIETVLVILLTPIAWVLAAIFERLFQGANPFEAFQPPAPVVVEGDPQAVPAEPSVAERVGLFGLRTLALVGVTAVVLGIIVAWTRIRRRYAAIRERSAVAAGAGGLGEDLRALLRALRPGRGATRPAAGGSAAARLYLDVLEDAEHRGRHREPSQTPHEFAPVLHDTFDTQVTDDITAAFEEARYAGREPDRASVAELERRWRALRRP